MNKYTFSENNSGGHWWLDRKAYQSLFDNGWCLEENWDQGFGGMDPKEPWGGGAGRKKDDVPYGWRHNLFLMAESLREAEASFERATGWSVDERGCDCCGRPFGVYGP